MLKPTTVEMTASTTEDLDDEPPALSPLPLPGLLRGRPSFAEEPSDFVWFLPELADSVVELRALDG